MAHRSSAIASSHVCASVANFMILERHTYVETTPMYKEIVIYDGPQVEKGFIRVSEKPGIGVHFATLDVKRPALASLLPR